MIAVGGMKTMRITLAMTVQNTAWKPVLVEKTSPLSRKRIAYTTPPNYADRLSHALKLKGCSNTIWCPTVLVETTQQTKDSIKPYLISKSRSRTSPLLQHFSAIAFTSRAGISAFSEILMEIVQPPLFQSQTDETFTISALGRDAELLNGDFVSKLCHNPNRIRVLVPPVATPTSLVDSLGLGMGRRVLCPVPLVIGLDEPPVIPDFIQALVANGWIPVRVSAYETRWAGPNCAENFVRSEEERVDAIVFTSTGEVEGLLKSLRGYGFDWGMVKKRWPGLVVAAHGPITAAGAERLGVNVDVIGSKFGSFDGVLEALVLKWSGVSDT